MVAIQMMSEQKLKRGFVLAKKLELQFYGFLSKRADTFVELQVRIL
jgi:hypothetical protein